MRIYCVAAFLLIATPSFACNVQVGFDDSCDKAYSRALETIDRDRSQNMQRQEQIEQQQHQNNLARIKRERELQEAKSDGNQPRRNPPPVIAQQPQQIPQGTSNTSAECRAFPAMCSAYSK